MSARVKRPHLQLKKAATHVSYELRMMSKAAELTVAYHFDRKHDESRLLFESFLIHCRNLLDFFHPPASHKANDMLATDFFPDERQWLSARPPLPTDLRDVRTSVNKLVAHLTFDRPVYALLKQHRWELTKVHNHLLQCARLIVKKLPPARRDWIRVPRDPIYVEFIWH